MQAEEALARRYAILTSIPHELRDGVGPVVAVTLIACLSELGSCTAKEIAALAGLAPVNWDSGKLRGQRHVKGGRGHVRTPLYMAAAAASRCNQDLKAFYGRLLDAGKKTKAALTAVMRKLVILANTLITENRLWSPNAP